MDNKKEYFIKIWGGAWNADANPSIEKDLGIKEGSYYFDTEEEYNNFKQSIDDPKYAQQGIAFVHSCGVMAHKRTIAVVTLGYQDKTFTIEKDFDYEYQGNMVIYMFTEGNYSCDCNLSTMIRAKYGEDSIPQLNCGSEIEVKNIEIKYED
jgi:hypothetical protein